MFPHHPHHHHHRRHRRMGPIGSFVRAKLRRRIFAWFLGGILTTGFIVFLVMSVVARVQEPEWARQWERSQEWVGQQFAREWGDPVARERYARQTAELLEANVDLYDPLGTRLLSTGDLCRHSVLEAPVKSNGALLGTVNAPFQVGQPVGIACGWVNQADGLFAHGF